VSFTSKAVFFLRFHKSSFTSEANTVLKKEIGKIAWIAKRRLKEASIFSFA
jgi:hypothetical protein